MLGHHRTNKHELFRKHLTALRPNHEFLWHISSSPYVIFESVKFETFAKPLSRAVTTSPSINVTARHSRTGLPVKEARNLPNLKIHEKKKKKKKRERKLRQQLFCTNNQANKENM